MQAEFEDMRMQDTVAAGFQVLQSDWNHRSEFVNVEEQKNNSIGAQLRSLKIEIVLLQSSLSALNGEFVQIKANLSNLSEEGTNSQGDVHSTQATMVSLKADTSALKGDTHILKSKVVANTVMTVAVQSQVNNVLETYLNIAHEHKTLKTDVVLLHSNLMAIKTDMASINKDFIGVKWELSSSIEHLTRMIMGREVGEVCTVDPEIHVKTDSDGEQVGMATAPPAVASTSNQKDMEKSLTDTELNTSEVTFKAGVMETYDRGEKAATKSPKIPHNSAGIELFNLTDSTIDNPATLQTQKTHDPNRIYGVQ